MKLSIEAIVSGLLILLLIIISVSFISSTMMLTSARNVHSTVMHRIEASNAHSKVINELRQGEGIGSEDLRLIEDHGDGFEIIIEDEGLYDGRSHYRVTVRYEMPLPFLVIFGGENFKIDGNIVGYTRVIR